MTSTSVSVAPTVASARAMVSKSRVAVAVISASRAVHVTGVTLPTMPKSMKPTCPLGLPLLVLEH